MSDNVSTAATTTKASLITKTLVVGRYAEEPDDIIYEPEATFTCNFGAVMSLVKTDVVGNRTVIEQFNFHVDQKKYFEDLCKPMGVRAWLNYQGCVKWFQADETGHKHCNGQYFDYWRCVDKCVTPRLFAKLK
ncbi:unnamed protein product [Lactuca virosa]|uniref:Complex III subunit VI n=1 Tax=Lactuca virosa TaxID=75947 RepID=A0AAU9N8D4_9ASTR|nr:unnamed protein product [Lactuca virosa]